MQRIIADKNQSLLEEVMNNFMNRFQWFERRLNNMEEEHRMAVGILLENHPDIMGHLITIFERNLDEDGFDMKEQGHWYVTREEYTLIGLLSLMSDGDELHLLNYKKGSGIIGLNGIEMDSSLKGQ
jgi:hypothetical protein